MTQKRFLRLSNEIQNDLIHIRQTLDAPAGTPGLVFLEGQITRWLNPVHIYDYSIPHQRANAVNRLKADLLSLAMLFAPGNPQWSYTGFYDSATHGPRNTMLALGFGHAPKHGAYGTIRLNQKMGLLKDTVASGVMVHEASHAALATEDHYYEVGMMGYYSTLNTNNLNAGNRYDNADNWRMFYQKMRRHIRG